MAYSPHQFAEKYQLALDAASKEKPQGGVAGFELEWNLLDERFRPLLTVGAGASQQSFVDYLRSRCLTPWMRQFSQLEAFHWMVEWATRPYYSLQGAVNEARLMEGVLIDTLQAAGREFGERLYYWHGNLLYQTAINHDSIPGSWHIAKRRYLERCVDLYGDALATAGTHTNLSLPDPLFAWDFVHLPASQRVSVGNAGTSPQYLDEFKSEFYITATRLMRAFASLFIATSASTPLKAEVRDGKPVVVLTDFDSVRNLTFPNPSDLDLPDLYRSYNDYLHLSYDLVRNGVRFGNNNWTPVRARSFAEPVERLIAVTSGQLDELYARGLYALGEEKPADEMARQIEMQNLMARINIPMARVEIRTDDGGHPIEVDMANLALKHLLLLRFYADAEFGRAFRYDREDIQRARRNERIAAQSGLAAEIENPFNAKPVGMREFLTWTLAQVGPLADASGCNEALEPLREMAAGGANTASKIRAQLQAELGPSDIVSTELLQALAAQREQLVRGEVEEIATGCLGLEADQSQLCQFLQQAAANFRGMEEVPIAFRSPIPISIDVSYPDKTSEVVALAEQLISIPSVTACPEERLEEVCRAAQFVNDYLEASGLETQFFDRTKYPAILATFPGAASAPVMLCGHFDVVQPEPDDTQFEPRLEGDYLWGRGAADMKAVVATYMVWMKDALRKGAPYPPMSLLLIGNEENGESEPMGTAHVLERLRASNPSQQGLIPGLMIAGERTGEKGDELWGEICIQNRGVMRFDIAAYGERVHSGMQATPSDLTERMVQAHSDVKRLLSSRLTLVGENGWQSGLRMPFIQTGTPGVYNITPDFGVLGVEIRPIPQDDLQGIQAALAEYCASSGLELRLHMMENGIACDLENPYLQALVRAVRQLSGMEPVLGKKLPATSARFAPGGQGVVWGQSGIGPHSREERHYLPSILPYYHALDELAKQVNPR